MGHKQGILAHNSIETQNFAVFRLCPESLLRFVVDFVVQLIEQVEFGLNGVLAFSSARPSTCADDTNRRTLFTADDGRSFTTAQGDADAHSSARCVSILPDIISFVMCSLIAG